MKNYGRYVTFNRVVGVLVVGIMLNVSYIGYLAFWPFKTITIHNQPFTILHKPIHPGDVLSYQVDYCRYTSVPAIVSRTLIGPTTITIAANTESSTTEKGCRVTTVSNTVIPSYAPPGMYYLKITPCYQVNPLRNICHQLRTEKFEVF